MDIERNVGSSNIGSRRCNFFVSDGQSIVAGEWLTDAVSDVSQNS